MPEAARMRPDRRHLTWALATLALGLFIIVYKGPGHVPLRNWGGDVAVTWFMFHVLCLVFRAKPLTLAGVSLAIAVFTEFAQAVGWAWSPGDSVAVLITGNSYDPVDLAAYVVGCALGLAVTRRFAARAPRAGSSPSPGR